MTIPHSERARQIAENLTTAQRALLEGLVTGQSYRSYRTVGGALVRLGVLRVCLGGFFEATPLGLSVRQILQESPPQ